MYKNYNDVSPKIIKKILNIKNNKNNKNNNNNDDYDKDIIPIGFPLTTLPIVPIQALKPGYCVDCYIKKIITDGLILEFNKVFQGIVGYSYLDKLLENDWKNHYQIVLIHPIFQMIHLSLKPHLTLQSNEQLLPISLKYDQHIPPRC